MSELLRLLRLLDRENELRVAALYEHGAAAVLADFYEEHGQPSRAAMWRDPDGARRSMFSAAHDFTVTRHSPSSPIDPRRNAMIWLLSCVAHSRTTNPIDIMGEVRFLGLLPRLFKLGAATLRTIVKQRDRMIWESAIEEVNHPTMRATQRLAAAGALPSPTPGIKSTGWRTEPPEQFLQWVELPPDTWPVTDRDVRRRRAMSPGTWPFTRKP